MGSIISATAFGQYLVHQTPVFDKEILRDMRPTEGWVGHVSTGVFQAFQGTQLTIDRFHHVQPDMTKRWTSSSAAACTGTPCDKDETRIGWGNTRDTYDLEEASFASDLLCFDQQMHVTHAREHIRQIISDILRPATSDINSDFLRKRCAANAGTKWLADSSQTSFTFAWDGAQSDITMTVTGGDPTSALTGQMLQRRYHPLLLQGACGKNPTEMGQMLELCTDLDTLWELNKGGFGIIDSTPTSLNDRWRFTEWADAGKFFKYGWTGAVGNFGCRVDLKPLRFKQLSAGSYQVVYPFRNVAATNGIKSIVNTDYQDAEYQFSYIHNRNAFEVLVANAQPINPMMPFAARDFGGKWQFVMDNLGEDNSGNVIENKRRNKGQFIADFKMAFKPRQTEWEELIFHKRRRPVVTTVSVASQTLGDQVYLSYNYEC